jgi:DNA primase
MSKLSVSQRKYLETAVEAYEAQVSVQVAAYLVQRGITKEVAHTYRLGGVVEPLVGDEEFTGRLSIPYITRTGVIDIRYRALAPDQTPKYLSRTGSQIRLYNVSALLKPSETIAICEGEIDAITMDALVGVPAVGVPGSNSWRDHFRLLFEDYSQVLVMCDGDQAGREFGKRIAGEITGATIIHMPEGTDVNDVYVNEGADGVKKRIGL